MTMESLLGNTLKKKSHYFENHSMLLQTEKRYLIQGPESSSSFINYCLVNNEKFSCGPKVLMIYLQQNKFINTKISKVSTFPRLFTCEV